MDANMRSYFVEDASPKTDYFCSSLQMVRVPRANLRYWKQTNYFSQAVNMSDLKQPQDNQISLLIEAFRTLWYNNLKWAVVRLVLYPPSRMELSSPFRESQASQTLSSVRLIRKGMELSSPNRKSQAIQNTVQRLMDNYCIIEQMMNLLSQVAHSSDQLTYVASAVADNVLALEQQESKKEKEIVENLFTPEIVQLIKNQKVKFHGIQKIFLQKMKQEGLKQIKTESMSRIYHKVANILKTIKIDQRTGNLFSITLKRSNGYKVLSQAELEELVKYEAVRHHTQKIGDALSFKYLSICQQSKSIHEILLKCFRKHGKTIKDMKFNLDKEEVMEMANISREACDYYDNGVFLLLVYFVTSCKALEVAKQSVETIEKKMKIAIELVSAKYPPGQGLKQEQYKDALKGLQHKPEKVQFVHAPQQLDPQGRSKQQQAEDIITNYAKIAKRNKEHFQELIKNTCLNRCLQKKVGLKYNPDNPNPKAMIRIKEKMFFKKDGEVDKKHKSTINETLAAQEKAYKETIDLSLKEKSEIRFKISDMVRGKCTFLSIPDIIATIKQIQAFIIQDQRKNSRKRFRIIEIQSRFTNKVPISDVTLKIVINEEIVAELQLTIQTNAAAYNFAHKIYELQRTKVFSKVKISHNYFEQYRKQFKELALKTLELNGKKTQKIRTQEEKIIRQYFSLNDVVPEQFKQVLERILYNKFSLSNKLKQSEDSLALSVSTDEGMQDLMKPIFNKHMGKWGKELGTLINSTLKKKHSPKLKATLLSFFFSSFDLTKEIHPMIQFNGTTYIGMAKADKKTVVEEYLRNQFAIDSPFEYGEQTQKIYGQMLQLQQITLQQISDSSHGVLSINAYVEDVAMEEESLETIGSLRQFVNSFYTFKDQHGRIVGQFQRYYDWMLEVCGKMNILETVTVCQAKLLMAQKLLEQNSRLSSVKHMLQKSKAVFKEKQEQLRVLDCQLLLAECKIGELSLSDFKKQYQKVLDTAGALGLQMQGATVTKAEWRIAKKLWSNTKDEEEKKYILKSHYSRAIRQSSKSEGEVLINKMKEIWKQFETLKVKEPQMCGNKSIKIINLAHQKNEAKVCAYLKQANWTNLTQLNLRSNSIGSQGCAHLKQANWTNLMNLNLQNDSIGDQGCVHLKQANWTNITYLNLSSNGIGDQGCAHLKQASWTNLISLNLYSNRIGDKGCAHLKQSNWPKIISLNLYSNRIGDKGCAHLKQANWTNNLTHLDLHLNSIGPQGCAHLKQANLTILTSLNLGINKIGDQGCVHLKQANWTKNLTELILQNNSIGPQGCAGLKKANLTNITSLDLAQNSIGSQGCAHLKQANCINITSLNLRSNSIGPQGCAHLKQANWTNITQILLYSNRIGEQGCAHLKQASWTNLTSLNLGNIQITSQMKVQLNKKFYKYGYQVVSYS